MDLIGGSVQTPMYSTRAFWKKRPMNCKFDHCESLICDSQVNLHESSQIIHGWKEEIHIFKMDLNFS